MITLKETASLLLKGMPKHLYRILLLTVAVWAYTGFKSVEPTIFPVVSEFAIEFADRTPHSVSIAGTMNKVRDCRFEGIVAYSGDRLVSIEFTETQKVVSRVEGKQSWGWWVVTPPVGYITLYAEHACMTGMVRTKLYDGVL